MGKAAVAPIRLVARVPDEPGEYVADRRMTFEEYLELDHERGLAEWIDGEVHFYVGATSAHQRVIDFLVTLINGFLQSTSGGRAISSGFVVKAGVRPRGREPDVVVVLAEHASRLRETFLDGPPDVVVEVVSDESVDRDNVTKRQEYEAAGIPEYWIIDPRDGSQSATFLVLREGQYEAGEVTDGAFRSEVMPGFWVRPEWLWEEWPNFLVPLREILGERMP